MMMFMHMRRDLVYICKNNSFSLSLVQSFSTSRARQNISSAVFEILVRKHHLCPDAVSQVASSFSRMKSIEACDSVLSFLKEVGVSNPQLEKILKCRPRVLLANLEKVIKPKIKVFKDSGFSGNDISQLITNDPDVLHRSLKNKVIPTLLALKDLYGSNFELVEALTTSWWHFMRYDVKKTIVPNVEYLKSCGVAVEQIRWLLYHSPRTLCRTPQNMVEFVNRVDEMGVERSSKMFIHAIRALDSMKEETWERKWKAFENLGFSKDDILAVCRKNPQLFCVSEEKMNKFKEVVLASGKYDMSCVVKYPKSLMCSVEKRYKPRLKVLRILESHNLIKDWPSFPAFYRMKDEDFFKNYVAPYLSKACDLRELESLFSGIPSRGQIL